MRYEEALEHAMRATELDPLAHIIHVATGELLMEMGRFEEAKTHLQRAIELEPDFETTPSALAEVDMALWNWCGAEAVLDKALARNPNNTAALTGRANLLLVLGKREDATAAMRKALAFAPDSLLVRRKWAQFCRYTERFQEAIQAYEQLHLESPEEPWSLLMQALTYVGMGEPDQAVRSIERAEAAGKKVFPKYELWFSVVRGLASAAKGDRDDAGRRLEEVAGEGAALERHFAQAAIHLALGEVERAYEQFEQALAVHDPQLGQLPIDPIFASHRSDPRFLQILEVMGLAKLAKAA
jgi:tetratricopeptide (TPR) repeat protein